MKSKSLMVICCMLCIGAEMDRECTFSSTQRMSELAQECQTNPLVDLTLQKVENNGDWWANLMVLTPCTPGQDKKFFPAISSYDVNPIHSEPIDDEAKGQKSEPAIPMPELKQIGQLNDLAKQAWSFSIASLLIPKGHEATYTLSVADAVHSYTIKNPISRPDILYTSCNDGREAGVRENWKKVEGLMDADKIHLWLAGGDQIYADSILEDNDFMDHFKVVPVKDKDHDIFRQQFFKAQFFEKTYPANPIIPKSDNQGKPLVWIANHMRNRVVQHLLSFYLDFYHQNRKIHGSIPRFSQDDDHESRDGRGSSHDAVEKTAKMAYWDLIADGMSLLMQRHHIDGVKIVNGLEDSMVKTESQRTVLMDGEEKTLPVTSHSSVMKIGDIGVVMPDTRTERTRERIMSPEAWEALRVKMESLEGVRTLYFGAPIPVVFPEPPESVQKCITSDQDSFQGKLSRALLGTDELTHERSELEDDMIDHWSYPSHKEEKSFMMNMLFDLAQRKGWDVKILSGDVHMGCAGYLEKARSRIYNLTSSGVGSKPGTNVLGGAVLSTYDAIDNVKKSVSDWCDDLKNKVRELVTDHDSFKKHMDEEEDKKIGDILSKMIKWDNSKFVTERNWMTIDSNGDIVLHTENDKQMHLSGLPMDPAPKQNQGGCCVIA